MSDLSDYDLITVVLLHVFNVLGSAAVAACFGTWTVCLPLVSCLKDFIIKVLMAASSQI